MLLPLWVAAQLPQDPDVRKGTLKNGMTYYIRHNAKEAGLADFYIAQRVGSILEEPRQRGLAHFLEHMAFNGTKNFPGKNGKPGIVPWCESIGVKFGANLNAYTSIDQTVYHIGSAPLTREGIIDSCLLVLHDWSHYLLLEDEEIDKERGVIHEEWRTRRAGMAVQRMQEDVLPIIYLPFIRFIFPNISPSIDICIYSKSINIIIVPFTSIHNMSINYICANTIFNTIIIFTFIFRIIFPYFKPTSKKHIIHPFTIIRCSIFFHCVNTISACAPLLKFPLIYTRLPNLNSPSV